MKIAVIAGIAAVALAAALISSLLYRWRVRKILDRILERIDNAISGNYSEVQQNESMETAIGDSLNELMMIIRRMNQKHDEEQKTLKLFLSNISHQVKTPLSNMIIYSQLLEDSENLDEEEKGMLQTICSQAEKLDFLVGTLIKASQLETEMIQLHPAEASIDELVENCIQAECLNAKQKGITILWEPSGKTGVLDLRWMEEAVGNILNNAVKYSGDNSEVKIFLQEFGLFYCIHIQDFGPGIGEEEQGKIFQRFYRSEKAFGKPGLGIGLYLAREIVKRQGGYIDVVSKKDQGCDFRIYFPIGGKKAW